MTTSSSSCTPTKTDKLSDAQHHSDNVVPSKPTDVEETIIEEPVKLTSEHGTYFRISNLQVRSLPVTPEQSMKIGARPYEEVLVQMPTTDVPTGTDLKPGDNESSTVKKS